MNWIVYTQGFIRSPLRLTLGFGAGCDPRVSKRVVHSMHLACILLLSTHHHQFRRAQQSRSHYHLQSFTKKFPAQLTCTSSAASYQIRNPT
ncbi:hypothetical protein MJO28_002616 [Puccinia striiformis f. sp. tritici]|uniref:Uncharacterized protein n=1 Tax=Puccinia striiformis f. sp. tritici TaxID=168172 RepID=A0ACC0EQF2_9BASI|nr:hypothetical protein MJO28_002616 [Puccinia striiformis f. sp. tritici]